MGARCGSVWFETTGLKQQPPDHHTSASKAPRSNSGQQAEVCAPMGSRFQAFRQAANNASMSAYCCLRVAVMCCMLPSNSLPHSCLCVLECRVTACAACCAQHTWAGMVTLCSVNAGLCCCKRPSKHTRLQALQHAAHCRQKHCPGL